MSLPFTLFSCTLALIILVALITSSSLSSLFSGRRPRLHNHHSSPSPLRLQLCRQLLLLLLQFFPLHLRRRCLSYHFIVFFVTIALFFCGITFYAVVNASSSYFQAVVFYFFVFPSFSSYSQKSSGIFQRYIRFTRFRKVSRR